MNKKTILSSIAILSVLAVPLAGLAAIGDEVELPDESDVDIMDVMNNIANWLFSGLLIFAAIMIVIAGYMFVTAQGDAEKTKTARNFVMWALIGVLVAFVAKGLVAFVDTIVGTGVL